MTRHVGVYPGTFDPVTNGHLDIIDRAARILDRLVIGVAMNAGKGPIFPIEERVELVRAETGSDQRHRTIADELTTKGVALSLGGSRYDPTDPVGRLLFNVLAMVAEFERDLISMRTKEGMAVAREAATGPELDSGSVRPGHDHRSAGDAWRSGPPVQAISR